MELVSLVISNDNIGQTTNLIKKAEWENVFIISNQDSLPIDKKYNLIKLNPENRLVDMKNDILKKLKGRIKGTEVALSIASGSGKEHMAIISALLSIPVGIRFVALTKDGVVYL
ncbi:hypothetical protein HYV49_00885 [Candidatus Pacearchaeota archaeon]|nr:hypothetical protein [Candidatus Pacearchaeota archaeon]